MRAVHSAYVRRRLLTAVLAATTCCAATGAAAAATVPPTVPPATVPPAPGPVTTVPVTTAAPVPAIDVASVINVGEAKPPRSYDEYLALSLQDIQTWWRAEYPRLFGEPYRELAGGIYAAYPERTSPIPGCGTAETTYQEVSDFGAFYCGLGDFMAYDDGEQGVLFELAEDYGPSIIAVVMAHEFGHAIQERMGAFDQPLETIVSEQQADCISGAWSRRAWNGEASGLPFTDADVRTGLVALVSVRDPVGTSVFEEGGHGSAFDRIGAFQHGFIGGIDSCTSLIEQPLPLLPNEFRGDSDEQNLGNLPFGYAENQIMGTVQSDLIPFWPAEMSTVGLPQPELIQMRPVNDPVLENCGDPEMADAGAVFCPSSNEVLFNELRARDLYDRFGDFAVGYVVGHAWADGVQAAAGLTLTGEQRSLISDCLVGAWVGGAIAAPDDFAGTTTSSPAHAGREMEVSPGDLDEAVQTALLIGDPGFGDNVKGSAFEKIAYLRIGVLAGTSRCFTEAQNLAAQSQSAQGVSTEGDD